MLEGEESVKIHYSPVAFASGSKSLVANTSEDSTGSAIMRRFFGPERPILEFGHPKPRVGVMWAGHLPEHQSFPRKWESTP
jgi:hypothetical protein